jgi:HIV Tat-specific factor 1
MFSLIKLLMHFQRSPLGAVCVKFREAAGAEKCIEALNGRWFGQKRIICEFFDGVTNYKVEETEEEQKQRVEAFGDWLENS